MRQQKGWLGLGLALGVAFVLAGGLRLTQVEAQQATRELTLVNIKYEGSNIWVPGPLVVKKGDHHPRW